MLNIVLFGPPGAGKGTQSEKLIEKYQVVHLSTGNLFREHLSKGTDLGKLAKSYMDNGNLVPDEVVIGMVEEFISENASAKGFIFDGFPRTVNQANALDEMLAKHSLTISIMIALEVPEDELRQRIKSRALVSGRVDDQDEEKINTRIKVYLDETTPVAGFYKKQLKFKAINGVGDIESIFLEICQKIDAVLGS